MEAGPTEFNSKIRSPYFAFRNPQSIGWLFDPYLLIITSYPLCHKPCALGLDLAHPLLKP
jgi:hypothetical protein